MLIPFWLFYCVLHLSSNHCKIFKKNIFFQQDKNLIVSDVYCSLLNADYHGHVKVLSTDGETCMMYVYGTFYIRLCIHYIQYKQARWPEHVCINTILNVTIHGFI